MNEFEGLSRGFARGLGERDGRTTSAVIGTGLSRSTYGFLSPNDATFVAHAAMVTAIVAPRTRGPIAIGLVVSYLLGR